MISEIAYNLMEELYFVTHFKELLKSTDIEKDALLKALEELLALNWVDQLKFDGAEFQKLITPDIMQLERDAFLATKAGLLAHNGFGK